MAERDNSDMDRLQGRLVSPEVRHAPLLKVDPPASQDQARLDGMLRSGICDPHWQHELQALARELKATHVGYGYGTPESVVMPFWGTLPRGFNEAYVDREFYRTDSLSTTLANSLRSFEVDGREMDDAFHEIFIETGGRFGLGVPSIAVPMLGVEGRRAGVIFYGIDMPKDAKMKTRIIRKAEAESCRFHQKAMAWCESLGWTKASDLPSRELMCLYLSANGMSVKEMAGALGLSNRTIDATLNAARTRLGAKTFMEAVAVAVWEGIIRPDLEGEVQGSFGLATGGMESLR